MKLWKKITELLNRMILFYIYTPECENVIFLQNLKEIKEILRMEYR